MASEGGPRRIVVGVHGSAASRAALRWAASEARFREATVHVVRAWEVPVRRLAPYAGGAALAGESRGAVAADLAALVYEVLGSCPASDVAVELADGLAARVLLDRAVGASLLVIGATATDDLGPVARAVLRHAPCPVTLVTLEVTTPRPIERGDAAGPSALDQSRHPALTARAR